MNVLIINFVFVLNLFLPRVKIFQRSREWRFELGADCVTKYYTRDPI